MTSSPARTGVAAANGIELAYEEFGAADAPPVLLIMGFSAQLTLWPVEFCEHIAAAGYRVIRFDNRDIGLSTKFDGVRAEGSQWLRMGRSALGLPSPVPYTLVDMAADVRGLLDHLGIESAHIIGASMGGMIAQVFAAEYPDRIRSLGIVFSATNERFQAPPRFDALKTMITGPANGSREAAIEMSVAARKVIGSPKFRESEDATRAAAARDYDRSYSPAGVIRQWAAVTGTGSLLPYARRIAVPTVVIHGSADPLIRPSSGKAVARAIKGAKLHIIDGMGHDLPRQLIDRIARLLIANFG